jgi:hypothetical protein
MFGNTYFEEKSGIINKRIRLIEDSNKTEDII